MRRLAVCAYSFSAAAFLLAWLRPGGPITALAALPLLAAAALLSGRGRPTPLRFLRAALLGVAVSCLCFSLWDRLILREAEKLAGETRQAEAVVLDYPQKTAYGESVTLRLGRVKCRFYMDGGSGLVPGDRVAFTALFRLTEEKTGEDRHLSAGLPLFAYERGEVRVLGKAAHPWLFWPAKLGSALRRNIIAAADEATSPFLIAILTGERSALREDTFFYAMMREAGVLHCIAVSGMHLSFLVSFLILLLGRGKHVSALCIPVILLFMAVTGFTASVVRAGVMQLALCLSVLLNREYDGHTALALSLAVLTAFNPVSTHNVGLQLSFLSTLGILLFFVRIEAALPHLPREWERRLPGRLLRYVRSSLSVSFSALLLTLPVTAFCFGQIPLLGPLTNLLVLWAVTLSFGFGLVSALLGFLWPAGAALAAWPARLLVRYIALAVKTVGHLPFASLYVQSPMIVLWLVLFYGLVLFFRFRPDLRRRMGGFFLSAAVTLAACVLLGFLLRRQDGLRVGVLDVEQGQCVILTGQDFAVAMDCGSSNSGEDPGDIAARYLLADGRTRLDALILSHYDADHVNGLPELLRRIRVDAVYAPPAKDEAELKLLAGAEAQGVRVVTVSGEAEMLHFGALEATVVPPLGRGESNEEGLCALFTAEGRDVLVTGDASVDTELRLLDFLELPDLELLVAGHHGSASSVSQALLQAAAPDTAVISVGRNSYGLPSPETVKRLLKAGAAVYRTDECGTVEVCFHTKEGASAHE